MPQSQTSIRTELLELKLFVERARKITVNAKGEALVRAIHRIFGVAREQKWPEKAVIFTESRRTLDYLYQLLSERGYAGKICTLTGDASTPEQRAQLVQDFRESKQFLLSTEAGAEGLNLQFCNLLVNYDLPWNPQRVEQRIGRCHRYGQIRDVLVMNFLNTSNAADARLYELLGRKLSLFDGVFGASDEILGALESGVDFEKRILKIYQSCRKPEEIESAFQELRQNLETCIDARMQATRTMLFERFDSEVRRRLRMAGESIQSKLQQQRNQLRATSKESISLRSMRAAAKKVGVRDADGRAYPLRIDGAHLPPELGDLRGKRGLWFVYEFEGTGLSPLRTVEHIVLVEIGDMYRILRRDEATTLFSMPTSALAAVRGPSALFAQVLEDALTVRQNELIAELQWQSETKLDEGTEKLERYLEDALYAPRQRVDDLHRRWTLLRGERSKAAAELREQTRTACEQAEKAYRRALTQLRAEEESRFAEKDRKLATMQKQATVAVSRRFVANAQFAIS